jgi:hypothetical protein
MTATGCVRPLGIRAIRQLERLALSSPNPQIAAFARAFFGEHGPEACKMLAEPCCQRIRRPRMEEGMTATSRSSFTVREFRQAFQEQALAAFDSYMAEVDE